MLQTLADVGLDYVPLGQPAPTLSGGEAQRVKLASELGKPATGRTIYILDEPTTGLHFDDIRKLLSVMHKLVDLGNSVLVVENNLDVLKCADWIIDLGPEAGAQGGQIVAAGTPEGLVEVAASHTGAALQPVLKAGPYETYARHDPQEHAAKELAAEKAGFGDVGKDTKMPWQVDGRKWHLEQRTSRDGSATRWEPEALEHVLELIEKAGRGAFAPVNWNNRASVEVTAPGADVWFLHALTGGEWLLELYFRTPPGTFKWLALEEQIGLKTLDERDDLQTYGDWARVDVRPRRSEYDAVVIYPHDKAEIDTSGFRKFIRDAVKVYLKEYAKEEGTKARGHGGTKGKKLKKRGGKK
jgi:excinuclease ABC subunit A